MSIHLFTAWNGEKKQKQTQSLTSSFFPSFSLSLSRWKTHFFSFFFFFFFFLTGGEAQLKSLISDHAALTGSVKAQALLDDWDASLKRFWQVIPASEEQNSAVVDGEAEEEGAEVGAPSLVAK